MRRQCFLVEDNEIIRANLIASLEELADITVVGEAQGQTEAVLWLGSHGDQWHIAVVDLFLKEGNGLGVVEACQDRSSEQKLVVLSNYATDAMRKRCLSLGADAVFDKSNELDGFFEFCQALER